MWLHKNIYNLGYCSENKPKLLTQIGKENKKYYSIKFRTWSYSSFNYIYDEFYYNNIKQIPSDSY
jgi:LAGLIDADG DNA endonuclease family